ncbi:MAG: crossover junction endodeoxyribonuclease RuvC [Dehalococcoidia bacterium]|nr:crossover junction endodeoxyribonuclease RuvC [Dehalococcoidia bacterium]MDW8120108.1 crossover junction endodeoxyribonuclease RuvC [Chloroflexota bacterium]
MRVLGIDPGTLRLGYALVEAQGDTVRLETCGILTAPRRAPLPRRLSALYRALVETTERLSPHVVAIEEPFVPRREQAVAVRTAIAVGQAQGIAFLAADGLPLATYAPAVVKQVVAGHGRASKGEVAEAVRVVLGLSASPASLDSVDAIAIALCHCILVQGRERLGVAP